MRCAPDTLQPRATRAKRNRIVSLLHYGFARFAIPFFAKIIVPVHDPAGKDRSEDYNHCNTRDCSKRERISLKGRLPGST